MAQEKTRIGELKESIRRNQALLDEWRTDLGRMETGEERRKTFIMCLAMERTIDSDKEELKALEARE